MIIVKTKNGDRFINDKAVIAVEHDKEKTEVTAYIKEGVFFHIEEVESVLYTNDAQPTSWKDEGLEIERLKKKLDEQSDWGIRVRDQYLKLQQERDELEEQLAKLEQKQKASAVFNEMLDRPITDYPLSIRASNCLKSANINTLRELVRLTVPDLLKFRNFGKKTVSELSDFIKDHNLSWGMDV